MSLSFPMGWYISSTVRAPLPGRGGALRLVRLRWRGERRSDGPTMLSRSLRDYVH